MTVAITASISHASYDQTCERILEDAPSIKLEYEGTRDLGDFNRMIGLDHSMSAFEFESLKDMMAGLPIKLTFKNGKTLFVPSANDPKIVKEMGRSMNRSPLAQVTYLPDGLKKLGSLLKSACVALDLSGCASYDNFAGFSDPAPRPLTVIQEQTIKWAVLYNLAPSSILFMYNQAAKIYGHDEALSFLSDMGKKCLIQASINLSDIFSHTEAAIILNKVAAPLIFNNWQTALAKLAKSKLH